MITDDQLKIMEMRVEAGKRKKPKTCIACHGLGTIFKCSENLVGSGPCPMCSKSPKVEIVDAFDAFEGLEGDLQDMIKDECKKRGFYFVHSRRDKRTTTAIGTPDFVIACHKGINLWVECKAGKNKPSIEQMAVGIMLEHLNQNYKLVYNLKTFLDFVEEKCGEYICPKCGLRRDGQHEVGEPEF